MRVVMFVGPSLPASSGERPADIEVLPPAARGDVLKVARSGSSIIGLCDGVFGQDLAVTSTELREAHRTGALVYGAASMGALRAVDCPDAVRGVGEIFEQFRDGRLRDDDEAACTYDPSSDRLIAHPMVAIQSALDAVAFRDRDVAARLSLVSSAIRERPFHERTAHFIHRVTASLVDQAAASRVMVELSRPENDPKRRDALRLVDELRRARRERGAGRGEAAGGVSGVDEASLVGTELAPTSKEDQDAPGTDIPCLSGA